MKKLVMILSVVGLILLASIVVQADVVTYTGTVNGSSASPSGKTLPFSSIPKFDPAIGTLTGIKVTMSGSQSSTLHVWSIDGSDGTVKAYLSGYISVISDAVTLATQNYVFQNPSYPGYDPTQSWGDYLIAWSTAISPIVKNYGPSDTGFSNFIGATGNAPVSGYAKWTSLASLWINGNFGDTSSTWRTPFTFSAAVEYTYEPVTLVTLSSFTAKASNGRVKLEWVTEAEIDNAGFNIWRADAADGEYVKLNDEIIPAKGSETDGAKYVFTDNIAKNRKTYFYKLEDVDVYGTSTFHGPVSATPKFLLGIFNF